MQGTDKKELCLDGIKGLAACVVAFAWHYQHFAPRDGSPFHSIIPLSYDYGWLMVELFFMLSGFGMMLGYSERILSHRLSFKDYFARRMDKLYPLFLLTLVIVAVLEVIYKKKVGATFVYHNYDIYHFILNLLCLQNGIFGTGWSFNAPSWCVSISLVLYIVFYCVAYKSKSKNEICYKYMIWGGVGAFIILSNMNYPVFNSLIGRGLLCFSIGVFLARMYEKREMFNTLLLGYVCLAVLVGMYLLLRLKGSGIFGNLQMAFILGIAPMMIVTAISIPWLNKFLSLKPLAYLGSLSINIYLFHFSVQCLIVIMDRYANFYINYSSRKIWILYVTATLIMSAVYKSFVAKRYEGLLRKLIFRLR